MRRVIVVLDRRVGIGWCWPGGRTVVWTLRWLYWANGSVGKNKGGDTTTRTEIETAGAGSGKDLGFIFEIQVVASRIMVSDTRTKI